MPCQAAAGRESLHGDGSVPPLPTSETSIQRTTPSDDFARAHPVTCDHPEERAPLACNPYHRHELPRARSCRYSLGTLYQDTTPVECLTNAELTIRDHPVRKHALVLEPPPGTTPRKSLSTLTVAQQLCTSDGPSPAFHRKRGRMAPLARSSPPSSATVQLLCRLPSSSPSDSIAFSSLGLHNDWRSAAWSRGSAATEGLVSCNVRVRPLYGRRFSSASLGLLIADSKFSAILEMSFSPQNGSLAS